MKIAISTELNYYVPKEADLLLQLEAAMILEQRVLNGSIEMQRQSLQVTEVT